MYLIVIERRATEHILQIFTNKKNVFEYKDFVIYLK